jgi:hypothetical protein
MTVSWLKGLRRMRVRYDRLGVIQEAWNTMAASRYQSAGRLSAP